MTKELFIFLLEQRKAVLDCADALIDAGFDIDSERCGELFAVAEALTKRLNSELELESFAAFGGSTLEWALEWLDSGKAAIEEVGGVKREVRTFEQLWEVIQRELE